MQSQLAVGQEVMTTSGLFGRLVELDTDSVVLEVADGVRLKWARPAIARVVGPAATGTSTTETPATDAPPTGGPSTEEPPREG
jgi:preprotein translocase subunit YajC